MSCPAHGLAESRRMITPEDVDHIRELASRLPSKGIVVDLGTGSGTALLAVLAERNDDVHIHSYDLDVQWGQAVVKNVERVGDVTFHQEDIFAVETIGKTPEIDLLLIDLLPDRTGDILDKWIPLVRPGGLVWVHDYGIDDVEEVPYSEVKRAVDLLVNADAEGSRLVFVGIKGNSWAGGILLDTPTPPTVEQAAEQESPLDPLASDDEADAESADPQEEVPPSSKQKRKPRKST